MAYVYKSESRGKPVYIATCPHCHRDLSQGSIQPMTRLAEAHDRCFHGD